MCIRTCIDMYFACICNEYRPVQTAFVPVPGRYLPNTGTDTGREAGSVRYLPLWKANHDAVPGFDFRQETSLVP